MGKLLLLGVVAFAAAIIGLCSLGIKSEVIPEFDKGIEEITKKIKEVFTKVGRGVINLEDTVV